MTVFGDAVAPRGGTVWIGSLIKALADFGISERLVRTSVFRLTQDDWLIGDQLGRRSYYGLSAEGARQFEHATTRIYGEPRPMWSGDWCLVLLADLAAAEKELVRKELGWQGFASISSSVLAHPSPNLEELDATLRQIGLQQKLVVMQGKTLGKSNVRIIFDDSKPTGQVRKATSIEKMKSVLGFTPRYTIHDGLKKTISWLSENENVLTSTMVQ